MRIGFWQNGRRPVLTTAIETAMPQVLRVVDAGQNGEGPFDLVSDRLTVGRDLTADIVLDSLTVGRRHAVLIRGEDGYVIEDLMSRPGTFVNGARIKEPVLLNNGDIIRMGSVTLSYHCTAAET